MKFITINSSEGLRIFNLSYILEVYGSQNYGNDCYSIMIETSKSKSELIYYSEKLRDEVLEELIQKIHEKTDYND